MQTQTKYVLVAPLNWGLGHATRSIPVIRELIANGYNPIIASDGGALALLKKEFPDLQHLELPPYDISYPAEEKNFKWKMLRNAPRMIEAMIQEKKIVKKWVKEHNLCGIISDNRLGVYSKKVPSVIITHQLNVLSGNTSWLTGQVHRQIIKKFKECWVPDSEKLQNLSGKLGHADHHDEDIKYIGLLSRFEKKWVPIEYDLMILLSGPEPQRSILENKLKVELESFTGNAIFIRGVVENEQVIEKSGNFTFYNFMTSTELELAMNASSKIICRSGYTTIMDLSKIGKKAFFIPTPGQYEQEYLAKKMKKEGYAPYAKQDKFRFENLLEIDLYKGIPPIETKASWKNLFCLFECE